jgi:hypothetical protein
VKGQNGAIGSNARYLRLRAQMTGATEIMCSQFGGNIIPHM